jgi:hypothetical protein
MCASKRKFISLVWTEQDYTLLSSILINLLLSTAAAWMELFAGVPTTGLFRLLVHLFLSSP